MARTEPNPSAPQGSQLLRQFIDASGGSIPSFAEEHDLDRVQLMRLIEGSGAKRVTVNLASRIERATSGAVPVSAWLTLDPAEAEVLHDAAASIERGAA